MAKDVPIIISDPIDQIFSYLRYISIESRTGLKESFLALAKGQKYKIRELHQHASETGKQELNGECSTLWQLYSDYLSKKTQGFENHDAATRTEILMDVVIFAGWNAQNYTRLMKFSIPEELPAFPAPIEDISKFPVMVGYMNRCVTPAIKGQLCKANNITMEELEHKLALREAQLIEEKVAGIEILMPLTRPKSPSSTSTNPSSLGL